MAARVMTNVVAAPIPRACSIFLDTPINGHTPKKYVSTKFCVTEAAMNINIRFAIID